MRSDATRWRFSMSGTARIARIIVGTVATIVTPNVSMAASSRSAVGRAPRIATEPPLRSGHRNP